MTPVEIAHNGDIDENMTVVVENDQYTKHDDGDGKMIASEVNDEDNQPNDSPMLSTPSD